MLKKKKLIVFFILIILFSGFNIDANTVKKEKIKSPKEFFGFLPGTDRNLFGYEKLIAYFKYLDSVSKMIKMVEIGKSPLNKPIYIAFISSEKNINNLDKLKNINKELALNYRIPNDRKKEYFKEGKVFVYETLSMHSGEVGPSQAAPLVAYKLITNKDKLINKQLDDVVLMIVPCHNPDGMDMVVDFYNKYKNTKYEGASMPGVYHKYVGHDNNRDFVTLSQTDTKAIAAVYNLEWFPQVMVEKHQMGSTGARYFVPPNHDPIAENIDEGIWNWSGIFGANMIRDMSAKKLAGISQHYLFDDYWPGSTETCIWKNVIGFLTEAASAKYATPIYIESSELNVYGKGLSEYKKSINMPMLWSGGWWRLSDIMKYEISSTMSILKTASNHRYDILKFRNDICIKEVEKGRNSAPYYYMIPRKQNDEGELVDLVNLLIEHGVNVYKLNRDVVLDKTIYKKNDLVIPLSQPFRSFIKEVMEKQRFPERHYSPDGKLIKPYDITSWSLPVHRGINTIEVNDKTIIPQGFDSFLMNVGKDFKLLKKNKSNYFAVIFPVNRNESFKAVFGAMKNGIKVYRITESFKNKGKSIKKGSFIVYSDKRINSMLNSTINNLKVSPFYLNKKIELKTKRIKIPRIALIETIFHDMDAGWTRFIFDSYNIPFKVIRPQNLAKANIKKNFDVIIIPDSDKNLLMRGKYFSEGSYYAGNYPPEYIGGFGKKGFNDLLLFLNNGGTVISWRKSTALFIGSLQLDLGKTKTESFTLPVSDISKNLKKKGLYCPGSFMRIILKENHPLTLGLPKEIGVFFRGDPVFKTRLPVFDTDRRVIGVFPERNILISGYCNNEKLLGNRAVITWIRKNKGQLVLFGFNPQFRASTQITYKLLFNSLFL